MSAYNNRTMFLRPALLLVLFALPIGASAADLVATPMIIDGKGKPREILSYTLTLTNSSSRLLTVYPWVTNYSAASGTEPMPDPTRADLSTSLANWIELTRGVITLLPGESREIPILIQISLSAAPGERHALMKFAHGTNRIDAESNIAGTLAVPVNIEVVDDAKELLQLGSFAPKKQWFTGKDAEFDFSLENIGNRGLVPRGKVRIFDRRGAEVAAIDANRDGERIDPSAGALLGAVWNADGEFGRYKAMLDLSYGDGGRATLQDTVFFWVIPWHKVLGLFLSFAVISVILAILMQSRSSARRRYAPAYAPETAPSAPRGISRLRSMLSASAPVSEDVPEEMIPEDSSTDAPKLVNRTVIDSVDLSPRKKEERTLDSAVRLSAPKRKEADPRHVVNLRRP